MANIKKAIAALKKMGAPLIENEDGVFISAEQNYDNEIWADYYELGYPYVNEKIETALDKNGFFAEWVNPGLLEVCEA
jgi:hypothetical protein